MVKEQFRLEVNKSISTLIYNFMQQNNIPASYIEDALNKVLVSIKDQVLEEFIQAVLRDEENAKTEIPVVEADN